MNETSILLTAPDCDIGRLGFQELVSVIERLGPAAPVADLYRQWLAARPHGFEPAFAAWFNLGVELSKEGNTEEAAQCYRAALRLRPEFQPAAVNLGLLLEQSGDVEQALTVWSQATQPVEARTSLLNQQARLCERLGRFEQAERFLADSLTTDPEQPDAIQHWIHLRQKLCLWPVLTERIPGLSREKLLRHAGPLALLALTDDVAQQRDVAADWIARKTLPAAHALAPSAGYDHDRIRIGYLSSDFCRHAMSYLVAELFEKHDRSRFEVYGYCTTADDHSEIRSRILSAFDHTRMIRDLTDEAAAALIRNDEIDILVDLNGLTAGSRLQILRQRPAPIQATYLGFVGPVPLPELDVFFCDRSVVPADAAALYQPAALPIATHYQANDSKRRIGRSMSRDEVGLPSGGFVFACFSNHYKITEAMFGCWMAIMRETPGSLLWLCADQAGARENLRRAARSRSIDPDRLVFAERVEPGLYMSRLALADLFLDTFPYNAGTIASDAIRMGLPMVTLSGRSFASRMAASMLTAIGADDGIASSMEEYVAAAVSLASDRGRYESYRRFFTADRWRNTIGNIDRFTAEYEASLVSLTQSIRR